MGRIPSLTLQTFQSCNASSIVEAWRWLLAAAEANPALISSVSSFRYDLVDVGRQVLMDLFPQIYSPLGNPDGLGDSDYFGNLPLRGGKAQVLTP